jgi:3-phenylpropionate/trans-cinnamate dioxygenase ferredoxin subunit
MASFVSAFPDSELANNKSRAVELEGRSVLICRAGGELYAVENRCSHQAAELEGGRIRGCYLSCPLHGARFNLKDGEPLGQLTRVAIQTYPVRLADGMIQVLIG